MKILWHSNAPWTGTGYGEQTALNVPRIVSHLDHEVAVSAFYGLQGAKQQWSEIPIYPGGADLWGNDVLTAHALDWFEGDLAAGVIITLLDVWTLIAPSLRQFVVGSWCPVDHDPLPPQVLAYFQRSGAVPIAMSKFGRDKLIEAELEPLYVPHGVNLDTFQPRPDAREALGWEEDWFVVGMVAANKGTSPSRKNFSQVFAAFGRLAERRPNARLYLHTEQLGVNMGMDLMQLAAASGVTQDRLLWVDQYQYRVGVPAGALSYVYSAMDVLVNPSYGEGFGLPVLEAQACGTPVIVSDFSAMPELCANGWKLRGDDVWDPKQGSWWSFVNADKIYNALEVAYRQRGKDKFVRKGFELAAEYEISRVVDTYWKPALEQLAERLPSSAQPADLQDLADLATASHREFD